MLGALKAGIVAVPCSEMLRAGDIDFRVSHSGAKLVVADSERAPVLEKIGAPVEVAVVEELKEELRTRPTTEPTHDTAAEDTALILYTSGTTKDPKGVVHSHGYTWTKRLQAAQWLTARPNDLVWCTAGTGWAKSIWNVLLGPWSCGAEIAIHEGGFDAEERFDLIRRLGVTVLCQAPTEYRMMAKLPELERFHLGSVRHAVSAGGAAQPGGDRGVPGRVRLHDLRRLRTDGEHAPRRQHAGRRGEAGVDGTADTGARRLGDRRCRRGAAHGRRGDIALRVGRHRFSSATGMPRRRLRRFSEASGT